jgi:ligand-binding sensor domain-containing protein/signal transduction histidine kinase
MGALSSVANPVPSLGSPFRVDTWTSEDGLPQNSVIALTQTRDGYLWMGTLNGLVRFDGIRFTVFDESNTRGLASSRIVYLFEDRRANLWVGTETAGVILIRDGQAVALDIGRGSRSGRLVSATEDAQGAVWLYTADGQLCRYLNGRMDVWRAGVDTLSPARSVIAERSGLVWAGMPAAQLGLDPIDTNSLSRLPLRETVPVSGLDYLLASQKGGYWRLANGRIQRCEGTAVVKDLGEYSWGEAPIMAACEDGSGHLIVGTLGSGVYWYDEDDQPRHIPGLSAQAILSLCFDREGDLWVGTDGGGLNRVKRSRFRTLPGTENWVVQSVSPDARGGLWIGCNGGELAHWTGGALQRYRTTQESVPPSVKSVTVDRQDRVWVGTWGRGLFSLDEDVLQPIVAAGLFQAAVVAIHQDRQGAIWLGLQEGLARIDSDGLSLFSTKDGLTHNAVRALVDDAEGNLWIGTAGGGLNRMKDGRFTAYRKSPGQLSSDEINALHLDADGVLWIATADGGLCRWQAGTWFTYTKRDGLPSHSIGYLLEDAEGFLWLGSNAGLLRVAKSALNDYAQGRNRLLKFRAYGKAEGLPTRECTFGSQPAACVTLDGRLWFPTIKGLVSVEPPALQPNPVPPPVALQSVLIERHEQHTNALDSRGLQAVTLPAGKELLEIHYTSLNLAADASARQFRFRLEGHEADWIDAGNSRVARYSKLPPGDYTFRVTAANEDGVWNETGATLAVTVLPPFWRTWWFTAAIAATLVALIAGSVYFISTQRLQRQLALLRQQEALERERARIARDLHDQLGANLTQISLLGELAETDKDAPEEVEDHARQICHTARETTRALDEIVWAANPSNDTLEGLVSYVCKYAQEYLALAGLRYRLDVPSPLPAATLQPELRHNVFLAAKEAVNNVVKHAQATEARVALKLEDPGFILEIADNGRGPAGIETPAAKSRNGLRNMRKRMADIGGRFLLEPAPGGGSVVRLIVPLKRD